MARLFTWNEIKKNGAVYTNPVEKLLNSKFHVELRRVTENWSGTPTAYARLVYRVYDNALPDVRESLDMASDVQIEMNTANTTNNIESILLTVATNSQLNTQAYSKYFNPRYIHEVGDYTSVDVTGAYVMYEEPQAQEAVLKTYYVEQSQSAIKALANA